MEHGAKTDSDLARPPGCDHPATHQASPDVLTRSAARCWRSAARHLHSSPSDSVRQTTARGCSVQDDSGIEEEWAGGGVGQPAEDRSRRTWRGSGPTTSIRSVGGALPDRMTAETLRVPVLTEMACVFYTCTCAVTTAQKWY